MIQTVANKLPRGVGEVTGNCCNTTGTCARTWSLRSGGGGGKDPLLYVLVTIPLHKDIQHTNGEIKAQGLQGVHVVGTMGLIDDTGGLGDMPQECARQLDRVRALVRMCGQRCNVGKFWGLHLETRGKGIATVQPSLQWGTEGTPEARNDTHGRFLGENANPVSGQGGKDTQGGEKWYQTGQAQAPLLASVTSNGAHDTGGGSG